MWGGKGGGGKRILSLCIVVVVVWVGEGVPNVVCVSLSVCVRVCVSLSITPDYSQNHVTTVRRRYK